MIQSVWDYLLFRARTRPQDLAVFAARGPVSFRLLIVLEPGAAAEPILAAAEARFGRAAPQRFLLLDRLPRNEAGKVLKRELAALGLARQRN